MPWGSPPTLFGFSVSRPEATRDQGGSGSSKDRLTILMLTQYYSPEVGAAQTRLAAVVRELVARGHVVKVVTALPNYPNGRIADAYRGRFSVSEDIDGVKIVRVWVYAAMGTGLRRIANYLSFMVMSVVGLWRIGRADLVVVESPPLFVAIPGLIFCRLRRIPSVLNIADLWPDAAVAVGAISDGRVKKLMLRLECWAYDKSDVISTVTDGLVDRIEKKGVPRSKIVMLPNGVDTNLFRPVRPASEPDLLAGIRTPFVVYAGTMGLAHGLGPLIEAMNLLRSERERPSLVMLGSGSERPRLQSRCAELGLEDVHFFDPIPISELALLLPFALAGVVTAAEIELNETSRPAKLFPLMAAGLPVLHAGPGLGAEVVASAGAGICVANNAEALAAGLREMIMKEDARNEWGRAARAFVDPNWSWTGLVGDWLESVTRLMTSDTERQEATA